MLFIQQTFISQIRKFAAHPTNIYHSDQKMCCSSNKHLSLRSENLLFAQQTFISQIRKCAVHHKHLSVRSENLLFIQQTFISQIRKCAVRPTNIYLSDQKMCCSSKKQLHVAENSRVILHVFCLLLFFFKMIS